MTISAAYGCRNHWAKDGAAARQRSRPRLPRSPPLLALDVPDPNPKAVSERLGHGDIAITLRTYSHVLPPMQHELTRKLAEQRGAARRAVRGKRAPKNGEAAPSSTGALAPWPVPPIGCGRSRSLIPQSRRHDNDG